MRIVFNFGPVGFLIFVGIMLLLFLCAAIDVWTKDWRYKHFRCPRCKNYRKTKTCGHFRNSGCDCDYYIKRSR